MAFALITPPSADHLDRQRGIDAYRLMSFSPEKRADGDIADYVRIVTEFAAEVEAVAVTEEQKSVGAAEVETFRLKYLDWQRTLWAATVQPQQVQASHIDPLFTRRQPRLSGAACQMEG